MANFIWDPQFVYPKTPNFQTHETPSDTAKKEVLLIDSTPVKKWELLFKAETLLIRNSILAHYNGQYGNYTPFTWSSVPGYIEGGVPLYVRYSDYQEKPLDAGIWEIRATFESVP